MASPEVVESEDDEAELDGESDEKAEPEDGEAELGEEQSPEERAQ